MIETLREIDAKLGGSCRVALVVGGAVGSAPGEPAIESNQCAISIFRGDTAVVFHVDDADWDTPEDIVTSIVAYFLNNNL